MLITDPPGWLKGSYDPSLNLIAGSVKSNVGNDGVERVKLTDDSNAHREDGVRVNVNTTLRCRST